MLPLVQHLAGKNDSPNLKGFIIFLACSQRPINTRLNASASEVDRRPGLPHETGFAARTQGSVLPSKFRILFYVSKRTVNLFPRTI